MMIRLFKMTVNDERPFAQATILLLCLTMTEACTKANVVANWGGG